MRASVAVARTEGQCHRVTAPPPHRARVVRAPAPPPLAEGRLLVQLQGGMQAMLSGFGMRGICRIFTGPRWCQDVAKTRATERAAA